jgi:hypothetical protein
MDTKRETHSLLLSVLVMVLGMALLSTQLYAQQTPPSAQQQYPAQRPAQPGQTPDQSGPTSPDAQAQTPQAGVRVFTGTIVKTGDQYVLQDSASGATYDVDAQDQLKQFEGKKVRIHGTLDASGKMIHVQ